MKNPYSFYRLTLTAGQILQTSVFGNFLNMLSNTSATNIRLRIDGEPEQELPAGLSVELPSGSTFTNIEFRNSTLVSVTIEFSTSSGRIMDNRLVVSGAINSSDTILDKALGNSSTFAVAQVTVPATANGIVIKAANANRQRITITNAGASIVYLAKDDTVTATTGHALLAGMAITLNTTDAIYGIVAAGTNLVTYLEE